MSWLTLLLLGLMLFLVYLVVAQRDSRGMPPGPRGLPLVGNLFDLLREDSVNFFTRQAETYGPVYSVQLGLRRVVVISSAPWMTQAFVKQGDMFNHRPQGTVMSFILKGRGIVNSEDGVWRDARRFTLHVLRGFGLGKMSMETFINYELHDFLEAAKKKVDQPYNIHYDLATSVLNVIWHMFVGERFPMGDPTLSWIVDSIEKSLTLVEQGGFLNYTPLLQFVGTFVRPKAVQVGINVYNRFQYFERLIEKHRASLDDPGRGNDLMYEFLMEQRKQEQSGDSHHNFTDNQLLWLVSDLLIVGLDTTVTTLRWCLLHLVVRPDILVKIQMELDVIIGLHRTPTYEDRLGMPYTEAFIQETFRFSTIVPLAVHASPQETTLNGFRIPARTWVIGNIYGVHRDKQVWGDPEVFRPERFLDDDKCFVRSDNVVAFSVGRRNCLGESLARMETFLFLAGLLQKFTISVPEGHRVPTLDYHCGVTLNPHEYHIHLSDRVARDG